MTHKGQTYIVQVTINPGVDYEVSKAEKEQLESLGLLVDAPADPTPGAFDTEVTALVNDASSDARAALDALYAGGGGGTSDHGLLTGLGDDDHTQYALADGTRGAFAASSHGHAVAEVTDAASVSYVDGLVRYGVSNFGVNGPHTFTAADTTRIVQSDSATDVTWTVPSNATTPLPIGAELWVLQFQAGRVTFAAEAPAAIETPTGYVAQTAGDKALVKLKKRDTDRWIIGGNLLPATPWQTYHLTRKDYVDGQVATRLPGSAEPAALASAAPSTYPHGITVADSGTGLADGYPADLIVVETVSRGQFRIVQRVVEKVTGRVWERVVDTADDTWTAFRELAFTDHNHDGSYATTGHNHDGAYAASAHTHPVGDVEATGTPDATNFLRGDGVWAVPAGGGGTSDHGSLTGLADDDHAQYALADGTRGAFAATSHSHTAGDLPSASATASGVVELATTAETTTGTDTTRATTPAGVKAVADGKADSAHNHDGSYAASAHNHDGSYATTGHTHAAATTTAAGVVELATTTEATTGTDTSRAVTPAGVKAVADTKAGTGHNHDAAYAAAAHNHDAAYLNVVDPAELADADKLTQAQYDALGAGRPATRVYFVVG